MYEDEHEQFRSSVRKFIADHMAPSFESWEREGLMDRSVFKTAGDLGFIGWSVPEQWGGSGIDDFRFNHVMQDEMARANMGGAGNALLLQNDITIPYFVKYCSQSQAERWLPGIVSGELVTAIAMTEPGTGSDLSALRTVAHKDGKDFVLNGAKTFITNGINSDLVIVACRTESGKSRRDFSLLVVERGMPGFERGRNLEKIGQHSADTAELSFVDVRVPEENVLGEPGMALDYLADNLVQERLSIGTFGVCAARAALGWTVEYVADRHAFGKAIADFQSVRFELADIHTEISVAEAFMERCVLRHLDGDLTSGDAAMAKLKGSELQFDTANRCLQMFGGYGYMKEYPISSAFTDARVTSIYGGPSEIMKVLIAKELFRSVLD